MTNTRVGLRLGAVFVVLITLLAGIAQSELSRMQRIDETLAQITGRQLINLQLARKALALSNDNSRIVMQIVLVENRALVETLLATRAENSKEITRLVDESEGHCESEKEKQLLAAVRTARKPYLESYLRAIHLLVDEERHHEAKAVVVNETLPALLKYLAAWNEFVEFQRVEVGAAVQQAKVDYTKAHRLAVFLIGLTLALAIAIAVYAARATTREMVTRISAKNEVSNLKVSLEAMVIQRTRELNEANRQLGNDVQELRQSEEHLDLQDAALEAAANAIVITDSHGTIHWVNSAFTTMTGFSKEEPSPVEIRRTARKLLCEAVVNHLNGQGVAWRDCQQTERWNELHRRDDDHACEITAESYDR